MQVTFDSVGGLTDHIQALKEMIVFPLLYPEVFEKFKIAPPRGVLFHGPPGICEAQLSILHCFVFPVKDNLLFVISCPIFATQ